MRLGRILVAVALGFTLIFVLSTMGANAYNNWRLSTQHWCADVDENGTIVSDGIMFGEECLEPVSELLEEI